MEEIKNRLIIDFTEYMKDIFDDKEDYFKNGIHCSSLGMCKRQVVLDYYGFDKKPMDLGQMLRLYSGTEKHELVQNWLDKSERFEVLHSEFEVSEGLPGDFVGRLDNVILDKATGKIGLTDTKTQNAMAFKRYIASLPKQNHIYQLSSYALGYKKMGFPYDFLMLLYYSTGSDDPVMFQVDYYKGIEDLMQEYIDAVKDYVTDILPDRVRASDKENKWMCSYCPFNEISCKGLI